MTDFLKAIQLGDTWASLISSLAFLKDSWLLPWLPLTLQQVEGVELLELVELVELVEVEEEEEEQQREERKVQGS